MGAYRLDPVSLLRDEDARYHWSDGAHKWSPPEGISESVWRAKVMAHLDAHRESPGDGYVLPLPRRPRSEPRRRQGRE